MPEGGESGLRQAGAYLGLAFLLPLCTVIGLGIGYLLDKAFGTHFLKIVFLLFGIAAGIIELLREVKRGSAGDSGKG